MCSFKTGIQLTLEAEGHLNNILKFSPYLKESTTPHHYISAS
jgi:hypothetical protein